MRQKDTRDSKYPKISVQVSHTMAKFFAADHEFTSRFITNMESN